MEKSLFRSMIWPLNMVIFYSYVTSNYQRILRQCYINQTRNNICFGGPDLLLSVTFFVTWWTARHPRKLDKHQWVVGAILTKSWVQLADKVSGRLTNIQATERLIRERMHPCSITPNKLSVRHNSPWTVPWNVIFCLPNHFLVGHT